MEEQSIDIDKRKLTEPIYETFDTQTKTSVTAENTTQIQNNVFEINQTNVVTYNNRIKSTVISNENLTRIRELCQKTKKESFPIAELCLGLASLLAGGSISALISGIGMSMGIKSVIFFVASPAVCVGLFVTYLFKRKYEIITQQELANRIIECLPASESKETEQ